MSQLDWRNSEKTQGKKNTDDGRKKTEERKRKEEQKRMKTFKT